MNEYKKKKFESGNINLVGARENRRQTSEWGTRKIFKDNVNIYIYIYIYICEGTSLV